MKAIRRLTVSETPEEPTVEEPTATEEELVGPEGEQGEVVYADPQPAENPASIEEDVDLSEDSPGFEESSPTEFDGDEEVPEDSEEAAEPYASEETTGLEEGEDEV